MERESAEQRVIERCPLFQHMPPEEVAACLAGAGTTRRSYRRGEVIYEPHEFFRSLGILLSGTVAVNKGAFPVNRLKTGDLFGAAALYNDEPDYVTTLRVKSDCAVLLLSEEKVETLLSQWPQVRRNYIRYLSGRIRFLSARLESLTGQTAQEKLYCYLEQRGRGGELVLDCSMAELARRLGMGRASLYRALDGLEEQKQIRREGKTVLLLKKKG